MRAESPTAATMLCAAAADETSRATMSRSRESGIQRSVKGLRQTRYRMQGRDRRRSLRQVETNPLNALLLEVQLTSGCVREVDNSAFDDRTTVVYPNDKRPPVPEVRDFHIRSKGQRRVSRGQIVHVVRFAAGSLFPVEIASVPRGCSHLVWFRFF